MRRQFGPRPKKITVAAAKEQLRINLPGIQAWLEMELEGKALKQAMAMIKVMAKLNNRLVMPKIEVLGDKVVISDDDNPVFQSVVIQR